MTVKIIESSKINNIRDLGGTETKSGYVLKNNLFIRCAVPMNIGKIDHDNIIKPSQIFKDKIIPISFTNNYNTGTVIIYFEIHEVYTDNVKRFNQYYLLT